MTRESGAAKPCATARAQTSCSISKATLRPNKREAKSGSDTGSPDRRPVCPKPNSQPDHWGSALARPRRSAPMANKTITAFFDDFNAAADAVRRLENAGIQHEDISLIANNEGDRYSDHAGGRRHDLDGHTAGAAGTGAA